MTIEFKPRIDVTYDPVIVVKSRDTSMNFSDLKVGDKVTRLLAGSISMRLLVTEVEDKYIHCGPWKFNRITGLEVDEDLGWDGETHTGSYLRRIEEN